MRTIRFLLLILLCLTVICAKADIIPMGGLPGHHPQPPNWLEKQVEKGLPGGEGSGAQKVGVTLVAANVQVNIKKMKAASGTPQEIPRLAAYIKGEFDLVGSAVHQGGKDLDVFFPLAYEDEGPLQTLRFTVTVDGKPAEDVKKDKVPVTDENQRPRTLVGYGWRLTGLKDGEKRRIVAECAMVLPQKEGKAQFLYFLRSGALWDGPIGREVVEVAAARGLRLEVPGPRAPAGTEVRYSAHLENHERQTGRRPAGSHCDRRPTLRET